MGRSGIENGVSVGLDLKVVSGILFGKHWACGHGWSLGASGVSAWLRVNQVNFCRAFFGI
jgi:hypothetical protein